MCWEIRSPRTESGIYLPQSVEHMFLARGHLFETLKGSVLNIIPRDAIDQYFLSAGMVQQEMLLEIEVYIESVEIHTFLV